MNKIKITYLCDGKYNNCVLNDSGEEQNLSLLMDSSENRLTVTLIPKKKIKLKSISLEMPYSFKNDDKLFLNGYQSWTDSREYSTNYKMKSIKHIPEFLVKKYAFDGYGDYNFSDYSGRKGNLHGFGYGYVRRNNKYNLIGSLSEENGFTIIYFNVKKNLIIIEKDCDNLEISNEYKAFHLCMMESNYETVFDTYFDMMGVKPITDKKLTGYTSWYNHYQNISEEVIIQNLEAMAKSPFKADVFQIDDGYQTAVGDWLSVDTKKFPNSMKVIADKIKQENLIPGIWLAPFSCEEKSDVFRNHPDWLVKNETGKPIRVGSNWSGFYALDIYNEDVRKYIANTFDIILNEWGFELVKLDFLYSACIIPRHNKTRGQIMCEAMSFLRECVGDKQILGCGVPLLPAFGKVEYCRIGTDISLDWDDKPLMRLIHRERVSTKNSIQNSIFRRHLDGRAFINDPDVFLLRDNNISLTDEQKKLVCALNCLFGGLVFTSDNVADYDNEKINVLNKCLELQNAHISDVNIHNNIVEIIYVLNDIEQKLSFNVKDGRIINSIF